MHGYMVIVNGCMVGGYMVYGKCIGVDAWVHGNGAWVSGAWVYDV